jgi:hypothetical protein
MHREAAAVCREWSELLAAAGRADEAANATKRAALLRAEADAGTPQIARR